MIDDGIDPLCELVTVCNPWHGSYDTNDGFRNRSGNLMPLVSASSTAASQATVQGSGYHRVDFDMPEIPTPKVMSDEGMEIWNKTLLYGEDKYVSIMSTLRLGKDCWPYKAPDGSVWHMRAGQGSPTQVVIYGTQLTTTPTVPNTTVIATISVPGPDAFEGYTYGAPDSTLHVNFDPHGGGKAAVHYYYYRTGSTFNYFTPVFVLEVTLTGGDFNTPPTASGNVIYGPSGCHGNVGSAVESQNVSPSYSMSAITSPPGPVDQGRITGIYQETALHWFGYSEVDNSPSSFFVEEKANVNFWYKPPHIISSFILRAVAYDKAGARKTIKYEGSTVQTGPVYTQELLDPGSTRWRVETFDGGSTWSFVTPYATAGGGRGPVTRTTAVITTTEKTGFTRDGAFVPSHIGITNTRTVKFGINTPLSDESAYSFSGKGSEAYSASSGAFIGIDWPPQSNRIFVQGRTNSNSFVNYHVAPATSDPYPYRKIITEYCDADTDDAWYGPRQWTITDDSDSTTFPVPDPETGVISKTKIRYF